MTNYEELSDLQINLLVAAAIGVDAAENDGVVFGAVKHEGINVVSVMGMVDYCNNPSDAWPIILKNHIWIQPDMIGDGLWHCYDRESDFAAKHLNPLRAAMIVFLMMQDVQ